MKAYWGVHRGTAPHIMNLGTRWRGVVSFKSRLLYFQEIALAEQLIGGWIDPEAGLDSF